MNKKTMVSITEANQNFSKVARLVDERGSAVILKNNEPKYIMVPYEEDEEEYISEDELKKISDKYLEKNKEVYKKLAEWSSFINQNPLPLVGAFYTHQANDQNHW